MLNLISNGLKVADKVDEFHQSAEEKDKVISERHAADMSSDNWLSKSIRPMTLLILLGLEAFLVILDASGYEVSTELEIQVGTLLFSVIGFYFNSKKAERVAEKNAKANIEIYKLREKQEVKEQKQELKQDKKDARQKRRLERKAARRERRAQDDHK